MLLLSQPSLLQARTWTVSQDGSGDFTSVVEALLAAVDGDSVVVRPGHYEEDGALHVIEVKDLVFRGEGGMPGETTIENISLHVYRTEDTIIENLRFLRCSPPLHVGGTEIIVRDCVFEENSDGALLFGGLGNLLVENVSFVRNHRDFEQGGAAMASDGPTTIRRCFFYGNESSSDGGALRLVADSSVEECVFLRNKAPVGSAIYGFAGDIVVDRCTLWGNIGTGVGGALEYESSLSASKTIVAGTTDGAGVLCHGYGEFQCCDVWGNELGDWVGGLWCFNVPELGNFSEDPLLCDPLEADLGLGDGSPCLPGVHGGMECGQIGAYGLGCGMSAIISTTWGRLKSLYGK